MFTLTDKGLLDRAARLLLEHASQIENSYGRPAWVGEEARKQKLIFDRLQRDARDLRTLGKRMATHFDVAPAPRQVKVAPAAPDTVVLADEPSISEQREMGVLGGCGADLQQLGL